MRFLPEALLGILCLSASCATAPKLPPAPQKITFGLEQFRPDGLRGPPDGLTSLSFEFCIPDTPEARAEVASIDPTIGIMPGGRGRVGCGPGQCLCIGSTHQPRWREILMRLSALPYVTRIQECFWE